MPTMTRSVGPSIRVISGTEEKATEMGSEKGNVKIGRKVCVRK